MPIPFRPTTNEPLNNSLQTAPMRIVYWLERPFNASDDERCGVVRLSELGFIVEKWLIAFPPGKWNSSEDSVPVGTNTVAVHSMAALQEMIAGLSPGDMIVALVGVYWGETRTHVELLRSLSRAPCRIGTITAGHVPTLDLTVMFPPNSTSGLETRFRRLVRRFSKRARHRVLQLLVRSPALKWLLAEFQRRRWDIRALDYVWADTNTQDISPYLMDGATKIRLIHSLDYERLLRLRATPETDDNFAVFLDTMGPLHPDYAFHGLPSFQQEDFFGPICRALDSFEERFAMKVVVAAHPRAPKDLLEPLYGGRDVLHGLTAETVMSARAVLLAYGSTSVSFAVASKKPLAFLTSFRFDTIHRASAAQMAMLLNAPLVDCDVGFGSLPELTVDSECYRDYETRYIKLPGVGSHSFWEIVALDVRSESMPHS